MRSQEFGRIALGLLLMAVAVGVELWGLLLGESSINCESPRQSSKLFGFETNIVILALPVNLECADHQPSESELRQESGFGLNHWWKLP